MGDYDDLVEVRTALVALIACIDTSAADNGPLITQGSMMAQVCKVLQKTTQYAAAKDALARTAPMP